MQPTGACLVEGKKNVNKNITKGLEKKKGNQSHSVFIHPHCNSILSKQREQHADRITCDRIFYGEDQNSR